MYVFVYTYIHVMLTVASRQKSNEMYSYPNQEGLLGTSRGSQGPIRDSFGLLGLDGSNRGYEPTRGEPTETDGDYQGPLGGHQGPLGPISPYWSG